MKYSSIYFTFAVGLAICDKVWSQNTFDNVCGQLRQDGWTCFDQHNLGVCMLIGSDWRAVPMAVCDPLLCCDSVEKGCILKSNCTDEVILSEGCASGDLQKHPTDCTHYYYCSRNVWAEAICPVGFYDDTRKSCVLGTC